MACFSDHIGTQLHCIKGYYFMKFTSRMSYCVTNLSIERTNTQAMHLVVWSFIYSSTWNSWMYLTMSCDTLVHLTHRSTQRTPEKKKTDVHYLDLKGCTLNDYLRFLNSLITISIYELAGGYVNPFWQIDCGVC